MASLVTCLYLKVWFVSKKKKKKILKAAATNWNDFTEKYIIIILVWHWLKFISALKC